MPIPGTVPLSGKVAPTSELDTFPVTDPRYGLGGLRTVADITERNSIPAERRQVGMMVYVLSESLYYRLAGDTGNNNWVPLRIPDIKFLVTSPQNLDILSFSSSVSAFINLPQETITDGGTY